MSLTANRPPNQTARRSGTNRSAANTAATLRLIGLGVVFALAAALLLAGLTGALPLPAEVYAALSVVLLVGILHNLRLAAPGRV